MIKGKLSTEELELIFANTAAPISQRYEAALQIVAKSIYSHPGEAGKTLDLAEKLLQKNRFQPTFQWFQIKAFYLNQIEQYSASISGYLQAIDLADAKNILLLSELKIELAGALINDQKFTQARQLLSAIRQDVIGLATPLVLAKFYCRRAYVELHDKNLVESMRYFKLSNEIFEDTTSFESLNYFYYFTLVLSGLGKLNELNKKYEDAISNYLMAINISETYQLRLRLGWHYVNLGNAFLATNDVESAYQQYSRVLEIEASQQSVALASAYANIAYILLDEYKLAEAAKYLQFAKDIFNAKKNPDFYNLSNIELYSAQISIFEKKHKNAIAQLVKSLEFAQMHGDNKQIAGVCKIVSSFYAGNGDYKNAYDYQILYNQFNSNVKDDETQRTLAELEVQFESDRREKETEILKLQAMGLQLKALRAQMNPHFVYNALNGIQNFITSNNNAEAVKHLAKFAKLMRQSLDNSDAEVISLDQEIDFLQNYLEINKKLRYQNNLNYEIIVDEQLEIDFLYVPSMIVQPYVENALEHGLRSVTNGKVTIHFSFQDHRTIKCVVQDNGLGRTKVKEQQANWEFQQHHKSKGTQITEQRLELLKAINGSDLQITTIDLHNTVQEPIGTRVEIILPILDEKQITKNL